MMHEGTILKDYILTQVHNHPPFEKWDQLCDCPYENRARLADVIMHEGMLVVKYRQSGLIYDLSFLNLAKFEEVNE